MDMPDMTAQTILRRYEQAKARRAPWERLWREAYDFALPRRVSAPTHSGGERLYDATAMDSVDQLAASLLGNLTPQWSQWFGLKPGPDLSPQEAESLAPALEKAARIMQDHFDRSNFAVEMHQCFLDLVVGGTASLSFEESDIGSYSAFRFAAVPLETLVLEEGEDGYLDGTFRTLSLTLSPLLARYPSAEIPEDLLKEGRADPQKRFDVLESLLPEKGVFHFSAFLIGRSAPVVLAQGVHKHAPILNFRWLKSPGEIYGRSPVMKALPDIRTANKVVELILKNASIAVAGIWQADDDGVLNPANIELVPGAIIPKAVGSQGLRPLEMPGRFDISQLVLSDLRARIRHALLGDQLAPLNSPRMTATEVVERASEMALILGATYGRLQSELLTPLVQRGFSILRRRGEVPDIALDGRFVVVDYRSPLARAQGQRNIQNTINWITAVLSMGSEASAVVNLPEAARYLGRAMGVPADLIHNDLLPETLENPVFINPKGDVHT